MTTGGGSEAHHYDALCVGAVSQTRCIDRTNGYYLSAKAIGHGTRYRSRHNACGIITWKPKGRTPKRRFEFQNGDIVRAVIPSGRYQGIYTGRVMTRASGYFSIRTLGGRIVEAKHILYKAAAGQWLSVYHAEGMKTAPIPLGD